jgi:hypothetical protein
LSIVIQSYRPEHEPSVEQFNQRLQSAGAEADLVFYERAVPRWLPPAANPALYNEFFLALDNGIVRGGYALKHQMFSFADGSIREVGYYHHPLSEGIVNRAHAIVGSLLLRDAMQRSPLLYCLGMGGYERPLPKMLVRLGWGHCLIPFYFQIVHPARFLKQMQALRTSAGRRLLMDVAAYSGLGWAISGTLQFLQRLRAPHSDVCQIDVIDEFGPWADELWQRSKDAYTLCAVRDSTTLRSLYPAGDHHFSRMRVRQHGKDIGWAVVGERRRDQKYGSLRVGSIIDCWASPEDALPVIRAATEELEKTGVDLIVSNQSHAAWCGAMQAAGFLKAESNFIFAASKPLAELLHPFEETRSRIHFTRADGDGLPRNF